MLDRLPSMYVIKLTYMPRPKPSKAEDSKTRSLREHHALHPHPEAVRDEAFQQHEFFDPKDRVQVRYEMLRRHRIDGKAISGVGRVLRCESAGLLYRGCDLP